MEATNFKKHQKKIKKIKKAENYRKMENKLQKKDAAN